MRQSNKKRGRFEEALIESVKEFFQKRGYSVSTHARLNIAWSNIISDIDIIATLKDEVIITEIKSDHDHFYRAFEQLRRVKCFANKLYIATNRRPENLNLSGWEDHTIGLLNVRDKKVDVIKSAKNISSFPRGEALSKLKKKCLTKLGRLLDVPTYLPKKRIEQTLRSQFNEEDLKIIAKKIALCSEDCETNCILEPFLVLACNSLKLKHAQI